MMLNKNFAIQYNVVISGLANNVLCNEIWVNAMNDMVMVTAESIKVPYPYIIRACWRT